MNHTKRTGNNIRVEGIELLVADLDRSHEFYSNVLSFEKISEFEASGEKYAQLEGQFGLRLRSMTLKLETEYLTLKQYVAPGALPFPLDSCSNDRTFQHFAIIVSDMDLAYERLRQTKVEHISSGPQTLPKWNVKANGIRAFYFRDTDRHPVEILQFPPGKGDPRWQKSEGKVFLGIDHTAIVVKDIDRSLKFYRDLLGLKVVAEGENYGLEQEHLTNVFGARVRLTSLRGESGPDIEFLEYLSPGSGRSLSHQHRSKQILHTLSVVQVKSLEQVYRKIREQKFRIVSHGVVSCSDLKVGFQKGLLVEDQDGHRVKIIEKA